MWVRVPPPPPMKIAIISDSHDNLENLKKIIDFLEKEKIKILLHCGDVASFETLNEILKRFSGKVYLVLGNMDKDYRLEEKISIFDEKLKFEKEFLEIEIGKKKLAICHFPDLAKKLAKTQKYDFVFYGHTHLLSKKTIGKTKLICPGEVAGIFFKSTFLILDLENENLELKLVEKL